MGDSAYAKVAANSVNRHKELGFYDTDTVHGIFNSALVAHVSFVPDVSNPLPVCLPMIARIGKYQDDDAAHVYVHGYVTARLLKTSSDSPNDGMPVCICATKIDGIVLALTPFMHNYNYRSTIIHGHATVIPPDSPENLWAMELITNGVCPNRWDNCRTPPDKAEITATRILKVRIDSASAKIYDAGVQDERKDLIRNDVRERVWTGVLPLYETLGTPQSNADNKVAQVPGYIEEYRKEFNKKADTDSASKGGIFTKLMGALW